MHVKVSSFKRKRERKKEREKERKENQKNKTKQNKKQLNARIFFEVYRLSDHLLTEKLGHFRMGDLECFLHIFLLLSLGCRENV